MEIEHNLNTAFNMFWTTAVSVSITSETLKYYNHNLNILADSSRRNNKRKTANSIGNHANSLFAYRQYQNNLTAKPVPNPKLCFISILNNSKNKNSKKATREIIQKNLF